MPSPSFSTPEAMRVLADVPVTWVERTLTVSGRPAVRAIVTTLELHGERAEVAVLSDKASGHADDAELFRAFTVKSDGRIDELYGTAGRNTEEVKQRGLHLVLNGLEQIGLNRVSVGRRDDSVPTSSPWGVIQTVTRYAENVHCVSTAGHGGFKLTGDRQRGMPAHLKLKGGWYEEDGLWAYVALAYPDLFTSVERMEAERITRDMSPDVWEAHFGRSLMPGESRARDEEAFNTAHAQDLVVTSAVRSDTYPGMVEVHALVGGHNGPRDQDSQRFLVPGEEYAQRSPFGFVIDASRHQRLNEAEAPAFRP